MKTASSRFFLVFFVFIINFLFFTQVNAAEVDMRVFDSAGFGTRPVINSATGTNNTGTIYVEISNNPAITYKEVEVTVEYNPELIEVTDYGAGGSYTAVLNGNRMTVSLNADTFGGSLTPGGDPYSISIFSYMAKAVGTSEFNLVSSRLIDDADEVVNVSSISNGTMTFSSYYANEAEQSQVTLAPLPNYTNTPQPTVQASTSFIITSQLTELPRTASDLEGMLKNEFVRKGAILLLLWITGLIVITQRETFKNS